jgi:hypothetical protein
MIDASSPITLDLDGLGGNNSISITGNKQDETLECWPDHREFHSGNLTLTTANFSTSFVDGVSGNDHALFHDSPGVDTLTIQGSLATMTDALNTYYMQAAHFPNVEAMSTAGGSDVVNVYRAPG